ncbi:hypothetical protein DPMN_044787 [Dreissena polymorpha]|uniref:Uncharacterized protein n=1 Tax=Dreissena polymorpha TaxID=45954 RepID=A0A9D4HZ19_DREPO|nr:hypothetical protein DPMN_044787 [Dreissena polymorpha]
MNLLTKFHKDQTVNMSSIVKNAPPLGSHVFQANTNLLTIFHEDWTINLASRVLTRNKSFFGMTDGCIDGRTDILTDEQTDGQFKNYMPPFRGIQKLWRKLKFTDGRSDFNCAMPPYRGHKNVPPNDGHVFKPKGIISELVQDIIGVNLLTKFHEDWTINVASRVLTRFYNSHIRKNAPPLDSNVFQAKVTILNLIQDTIGKNLLTKFHEDRKINVASRMLTRKNSPLPGGHIFQPTGIIFKVVQDIIGMNLLSKFHEDWTINVASRVKNALPLGSHVFQAKVTIFELIQDINLLTKFHEDWTINVASREITRQMLTAQDARRTKSDHKSSP